MQTTRLTEVEMDDMMAGKTLPDGMVSDRIYRCDNGGSKVPFENRLYDAGYDMSPKTNIKELVAWYAENLPEYNTLILLDNSSKAMMGVEFDPDTGLLTGLINMNSNLYIGLI